MGTDRSVLEKMIGCALSGKGAHIEARNAFEGRKTRLEMLQTIASHNSYHLGQVVLLRQMLHAWPPPSGGVTW